MKKIFLSYSRRDSQFVDKLRKRLQKAGHIVWVDRDSIRGGDQWRKRIVEAIKLSDVLILVLSPRSVKSDNVRKELDLAEEANIPIIPIEIAKTSISPEMDFQLVGLQKIFFSSFDKGFAQLLSVIENHTIPPEDSNVFHRILSSVTTFLVQKWILAVVCTITALIIGWLLLRLDIKCSSSSYQSDLTNCLFCTCKRAFDNNLHSRWASAWKDNEWIIRDLGRSQPFDTIVLYWESAYGKAYTLDVSNDRLSWTTIYTQTNGNGGIETITLPLTVARYVRLQGISRGTEYDTPDTRPFGYSLWEFKIYQSARNR